MATCNGKISFVKYPSLIGWFWNWNAKVILSLRLPPLRQKSTKYYRLHCLGLSWGIGIEVGRFRPLKLKFEILYLSYIIFNMCCDRCNFCNHKVYLSSSLILVELPILHLFRGLWRVWNENLFVMSRQFLVWCHGGLFS